MREIKIGNQVLRVRATTLALLFYRQEFHADLVGDFLDMAIGLNGLQSLVGGHAQIDLSAVDLSKFDSVKLMQLMWAMAKADAYGSPAFSSFPSFFEWVGSLDDFSILDQDVLTAVMEEATQGFFRTGPGTKNQKAKPKR